MLTIRTAAAVDPPASAGRKRLSRRSALVGSIAALMLALVAAAAVGLTQVRPSWARAAPPARPAVAAGPELDALRHEAAGGSAFAGRQLALALMARYDRTADTEDLFEAFLWVDRGWQQYADAELVDRLATRYCDRRVVRWHLLCHPGE